MRTSPGACGTNSSTRRVRVLWNRIDIAPRVLTGNEFLSADERAVVSRTRSPESRRAAHPETHPPSPRPPRMPLETPETSATSAIPHELREIRGYRLRDLLG